MTGNCSGAVLQHLEGTANTRAGKRAAQVREEIRKCSKEEKCGGKVVYTAQERSNQRHVIINGTCEVHRQELEQFGPWAISHPSNAENSIRNSNFINSMSHPNMADWTELPLGAPSSTNPSFISRKSGLVAQGMSHPFCQAH